MTIQTPPPHVLPIGFAYDADLDVSYANGMVVRFHNIPSNTKFGSAHDFIQFISYCDAHDDRAPGSAIKVWSELIQGTTEETGWPSSGYRGTPLDAQRNFYWR